VGGLGTAEAPVRFSEAGCRAVQRAPDRTAIFSGSRSAVIKKPGLVRQETPGAAQPVAWLI